MTYPPSAYARAFADLLPLARTSSAQNELVDMFLAVIERHRDARSLPKIIASLERELNARNGVRAIRVESARPLDEKLKSQISEALNETDDVTYVTQPNLIAGVRIIADDTHEFDGSLKRKLNDLFRHSHGA